MMRISSSDRTSMQTRRIPGTLPMHALAVGTLVSVALLLIGASALAVEIVAPTVEAMGEHHGAIEYVL